MLFLLPFKRFAQFSGRSGRAEYWQFVGLVAAVGAATFVIDIARVRENGGVPTLSILWLLITACPGYAVSFRRLHDRNLSGWLLGSLWILNGISLTLQRVAAYVAYSALELPIQLLSGVTVLAVCVVAIYLLVQVSLPGDSTKNRFGPPPRERDQQAAADLRASLESMRQRAGEIGTKPRTDDALDQIERLARLRDQGVLTDAEFQTQKALLLQRSEA